jgi:hypothetical protein
MSVEAAVDSNRSGELSWVSVAEMSRKSRSYMVKIWRRRWGNFVMKKLLCVLFGVAALATGPAMAADLEPAVFQHPPPPPVLVPVATWTGCYVGGNAGLWMVELDLLKRQ